MTYVVARQLFSATSFAFSSCRIQLNLMSDKVKQNVLQQGKRMSTRVHVVLSHAPRTRRVQTSPRNVVIVLSLRLIQ